MRKIEFRGKTIVGGVWKFGNLRAEEPAAVVSVINEFNKSDVGYFVVSETVGQYLGSNDSNEKPIYEGDIVKYRFFDISNKECYDFGVIVWTDFAAKFQIKYKKEGNDVLQDFVCGSWVKVIGNIHDNPELLKGEGK